MDKKSVEGRELWVVKISTDAEDNRKDLKPMVKYIANMHGNEVVGRELMVLLIKYLLTSYKAQVCLKLFVVESFHHLNIDIDRMMIPSKNCLTPLRSTSCPP